MTKAGLITLLFLFCLPLQAETVNRNVTGYGITPRDAVSDALVEGLKQLSGVVISAEQAQATIQSEMQVNNDHTEVNASGYAQQSTGKINYRTAGVIQQYEVLSVSEADNGLYEAQVNLQTEVYKTPGFKPQNRRSLAVLEPHMLQTEYRFAEYRISQAELARRLQQSLVTELSQTRRFSVMDRNFTREYDREKRLLQSRDTPISEYAKVGQVLGVDYMIVGTVTDAELDRVNYTETVTGESQISHAGRFRFEYRIIVMATRQIKWSGVSDIDFSGSRIPGKLINKGEALADYMVSTIAKDVRQQALNNIYPLRVVKISADNDLILNQGGVTLQVGDRYQVFRLGEQLVDNYTNESLGREEILVGEAEIVRVSPKFSVARMRGDVTRLLEQGMILRYSQKTQRPSKQVTKVKSLAW